MALLIAALVLGQAESTYYSPAEAKGLFAEANSAYGRGDAAGAAERYERLLAHGSGGADLLYNLGTAYLAQGKLGEATLYLERARRLEGHQSDIDGNLLLVRSRQVDQVAGEALEDPLPERLAALLPARETAWLWCASWLVGFVLLALGRWLKKAPLRWTGLWALVLVSLPAGVLLASHVYTEQVLDEAVVMEATLPARELPSADSKVAFEVHAGLKVRVMKQSGDYVLIRLPNGLEAWAVRKAVASLAQSN